MNQDTEKQARTTSKISWERIRQQYDKPYPEEKLEQDRIIAYASAREYVQKMECSQQTMKEIYDI